MGLDTLSFPLMSTFDWTLLPVAFAGGALGAALGASAAFIFTGIFVLLGVAVAAGGGGKEFIGAVAFGPLLGPHVSFAGGVAAAAYAARRGYLETGGRDLGKGLAGLGRPDVLAVGGVFGVIGLVVQSLLAAAPFGKWTDTIALTVVLSAILVRLTLGKTGVFGDPARKGEWLPFQRDWPQVVALGMVLGLVSGGLARGIGLDKGGDVAGFGLAAAGLLFLHTGTTVPVWHHIALPAAIAYTLSGGNPWLGMAAGAGGAVLGEMFARLLLNDGDTHIDPPAAAIATMTALLRILFGAA